ncbi:MAG: phosphate acyltransferase PlsX [Burkholderiaceae bacterium]
MTTQLAIDCMGGDHGLTTTVPAAFSFLQRVADARLFLVGDSAMLSTHLNRARPEWRERIEIVHASEVVAMDDPVEVALRKKKDSSMRVAVGLVKDGRADACVSAGNTGALMAISRYLLKTLEGIDRPAIAMGLPNQKGGVTTMLDLGANVDCQPEHLLQFAVMGSALAAAAYDRDNPTVGLLNIGEEVIKGNDTVKQAGELLRASGLNFFGNVEGDDIFKGTVDVVVCDGFVGNVLLKTSEGMAQMLGGFIKEEFTRNPLTWAAFVVALPVLNQFRKRVDHRRYNGAALLGLRGLVLKSHGSADPLAFEWALQHAYDAARRDVLSRIRAAMQSVPSQRLREAQPIATSEHAPE